MALLYEFGSFALDMAKLQLLKSGEPVKIEPLALRLLHFLIENRDHAVPKQDIFKHFWPEHGDHDGKLKAVINQLRIALGSAEYIDRSTRGFIRFIGDVHEPTPKQRQGTATQKKVLWAKILHLRQKGVDAPAYRFSRGSSVTDVFDEIMFFSLHLASTELPQWEWSIVSSGDPPMTHITHPWQPEPSYFDPHLVGVLSTHITPRCTQPSQMFLTVTSMYNGLQKGNEEVYAKIEIDAEYLRFVVDFASLPDPKPRFKIGPHAILQTPRGAEFDDTIMDLEETYPGIYTVVGTGLKRGQLLKVVWELDWGLQSLKRPTRAKAKKRRRS
jgi:DNA-binding winged helix-turn-helix (wHTH) protein